MVVDAAKQVMSGENERRDKKRASLALQRERTKARLASAKETISKMHEGIAPPSAHTQAAEEESAAQAASKGAPPPPPTLHEVEKISRAEHKVLDAKKKEQEKKEASSMAKIMVKAEKKLAKKMVNEVKKTVSEEKPVVQEKSESEKPSAK